MIPCFPTFPPGNAMAEQWEDRFKRAIADAACVPADVPLTDIRVEITGEDGYRYSSYTFADPNITVSVYWTEFGAKPKYHHWYGPEEVAELIQSFILGGKNA